MPTHAETKTLPFTADQMLNLVADVTKYPEFLPWCSAARVRYEDQNHDRFYADLVVGYKMISERFGSRVLVDRTAKTIDVDYISGPMKHLMNHWRFEPLDNGHTVVHFTLDFEFKSSALQKLMDVFFELAFKRMVSAFEARAKELYSK